MATLALALRSLAGRDLLVGFSGGLDSTVLLHALAAQAGSLHCRVRAIHVDHGLHPRSGEWASHCAAFAASLRIELQVERVRVARDAGRGLEAAAREARHAAFLRHLHADECMLLAHHRNDQAETVLLRLLRASASAGLAAMRPCSTLGAHAVLRPLLDVERSELLAHAEAAGLDWIDDPSNADLALDRNFLRHRILPELRQRWPQADSALATTAVLLAEDAELLAETVGVQLARLRNPQSGGLALQELLSLAPSWRSRILRRWVGDSGLPPLPGRAIGVIESGLLRARADSRAEYRWHGAVLRRWRDHLYLDRNAPALPGDWHSSWDGKHPLPLPTGERLELIGCTESAGESSAPGLGFDNVLPGVQVRARRGGERIVLTGRQHSHSLKHCLQAAAILPWQRERLPLLIAADGEVLAAGDVVVSARFAAWCGERSMQLRHGPVGADSD